MLTRRSLLLAISPGLTACSRGADATPAPPSAISVAPAAPSLQPPVVASASPVASSDVPAALVTTKQLPFRGQAAVVVAPTWTGTAKLPLLVALHGLGEARKGVDGGAWGWVHDYRLDQAMARLHNPPLTVEDFQDIYDQARVDRINASLKERPFRGLLVACPYTPDLLKEKSLDNAGPFATFVVRELLPAVRGAFPALSGREATGIDGVSLGGRVALLAGLLHPEVFGAIGSLQAALQIPEARPLAKRVLTAREKAGDFRLRMLTSEKDFYRSEILAFHRELERLKQPHEHLVVPGPHDYPFNRGPGAIEMLLWHDRVLRGEAGLVLQRYLALRRLEQRSPRRSAATTTVVALTCQLALTSAPHHPHEAYLGTRDRQRERQQHQSACFGERPWRERCRTAANGPLFLPAPTLGAGSS